jgi:TM2 domain-containing membrane protein YozV
MEEVLQQHILVTSSTMDRDFLLTNFLLENQDKFKAVDLMTIKQSLDKMSDKELLMLNRTNFKDPFVSVLLSIAVGELGIDRFYIGDTGLGVLKLITAGGLGIWWLVDLFIISNKTKENNIKDFQETVMLQETLAK